MTSIKILLLRLHIWVESRAIASAERDLVFYQGTVSKLEDALGRMEQRKASLAREIRLIYHKEQRRCPH